MIEWIQSLWHSINDFTSAIGDLIGGIVDKLREFFGFVSAAFEFVSGALSLIPTYYVVFGVIIVTILVVYLFVGREPGGD